MRLFKLLTAVLLMACSLMSGTLATIAAYDDPSDTSHVVGAVIAYCGAAGLVAIIADTVSDRAAR